jgi:tRNA pseudouridine55 synthase
MHGILVIDKPRGLTSHDVVRRVRRLLGVRRVGHTGTLDPLATGVLPVAVGEGTRLVQFLLEGDKDYRATLQLGVSTDSQDAEGAVLLVRPTAGIDPAAVCRAAESLTGPILQVPPMYSALKKDGVPLHRLARQGITVDRAARPITIHRLNILRIELPEIDFEVSCSKGTYVRTLAHDLGELLGCGGHLTALRRTRSGPFDENDCITLAALEGQADQLPPLLGPRQALPHLAAPEVVPAAAARLSHGIPPTVADLMESTVVRDGETVLLMAASRLLAIARHDPGRTREKRGDFELLRVFSRPEVW